MIFKKCQAATDQTSKKITHTPTNVKLTFLVAISNFRNVNLKRLKLILQTFGLNMVFIENEKQYNIVQRLYLLWFKYSMVIPTLCKATCILLRISICFKPGSHLSYKSGIFSFWCM